MFGKAAPTGPRKCAHPACYCTVEAGKKFCSDRCRDAHGMIELHCQCCRPGCECGPASSMFSALKEIVNRWDSMPVLVQPRCLKLHGYGFDRYGDTKMFQGRLTL